MKLIPLGGAEEVGATCTLLEIGGHKILVDAGIRLGQPDPLPDLSRISDFGGIEAVLVTHAHTDHTGALPVVHRAYPAAPVYATPGTQAIVSVLFNDALNIMKNRYEGDREVPLYNRELVDSLFSRMQPVQLGQTVTLFGGDLAATFFPAGHILGAACIGLQSANGESAFISGDISVTPQLTVGGMLPPVSVDRRFRPQVVMVESTYGNRMHANRATEERRLVETVYEVIEQGGRVLIPAFAVGRAQEVLLILAGAMARKAVAPFPVWVDGMVRSVCGVYTQHPYDLATTLRKQIIKNGNPFFGPQSGVKQLDFVAINTPEERTRLAESGTPGCIVASSGMLSGGPSSFYARYIARESKSAIFITGYQDEESPGRALLSLAETTNPAERVLKLDGESVPVVCRVGKYSLSAHVDAGEVAGLIEQLDPQETILVHGAGGAREALSDLLVQAKDRRIYLPRAADELTFMARKQAARKQVAPVAPENTPGIGEQGRQHLKLPASTAELGVVRQVLIEQLGQKALYRSLTVQEVAQIWLARNGLTTEAGLSAEEYGQFRTLLNDRQSGFVPDARRPFLYRLSKGPAPSEVRPGEEYPLNQSAALQAVDQVFSPATASATGLYKRGAVLAERKLILYFYFPGPAQGKYQAELARLAELTGWTIELNQETHQAALAQAALRNLPEGYRAVKAPAIYRETREVRLVLADTGPNPVPPPEFDRVRAAFEAETGYRLQLAFPGEPALTGTPTPESGTGEELENPPVAMEINAAFSLIEREFEQAGAGLLRKSLKQGQPRKFIELSFITSEAGQRYRPLIEQLTRQTGYAMQINPEPHQQALRDLAEKLWREAAGPEAFVRKAGVHRDRREIVLKVEPAAARTAAGVEAAQSRFAEQTGWSFRLE